MLQEEPEQIIKLIDISTPIYNPEENDGILNNINVFILTAKKDLTSAASSKNNLTSTANTTGAAGGSPGH